MSVLSIRWVLWTALAAAVASAQPSPVASSPPLALKVCRLPHPDRLQSIEAHCGSLAVLENPAAAAGRSIDLQVAVARALNRQSSPDPLFVLAGGPGQAAGEFYAMVAGAFARVQRDRDIVLVDQRGTGKSNALNCPFPEEDELAELSDEQIRTVARDCLSSLKGDPIYYTTSIAVEDLDRVRAALGYERINLYGISYGTRVAQHYLRRHPERVRAVILDGVIPPQEILGIDTALHAQRALDLIFKRCRSDKACRSAFADPAADFDKLRTQLNKEPAQVTFPDPINATVSNLSVRWIDLQLAVRLLSYGADQAALLPLLLHEGAARGNLAPLAGQSKMIAEQLLDAISFGMHNAVVCAEDVPFYDSKTIDRAALERSYLGTDQLDMLVQICAVWPRGALDADFHAPLNSKTPALLLSGSADPVTPPQYAEQALAGLKNAVHVILEGQGHGQLATGCVPRLMAEFLDKGNATTLDVSCARNARPAPFFVSFAGPAP